MMAEGSSVVTVWGIQVVYRLVDKPDGGLDVDKTPLPKSLDHTGISP